MRRGWLAAGALALGLGAPTAAPAGAQDAATPVEVVAKVRAAAALLAQQGQSGLAAIKERNGPFVFKDSYVFASDCGAGVILAHPIQPERNGQPIAAGASLWRHQRRGPRQGAMRGGHGTGRRLVSRIRSPSPVRPSRRAR